MLRIVVLGGGGVLARHFREVAGLSVTGLMRQHHVSLVSRKECDITKWDDLSRLMAKTRPDFVINMAAFTNVNRAEREKEKALRVNAVGATKAALAARAAGAGFLQVSTDYVFPGTRGPYKVSDDPYPINTYGLSKRLGEVGVLAVHPRAQVVRLGWLFGADYPSCAPMLAESENYELEIGNVRGKHRAAIWNDIFGHPTHVRNAAELLFHQVLREKGFYGEFEPSWPVVHIGNMEEPVSWYSFLAGDYDVLETSAKHGGTRRPVNGGLAPSRNMQTWSYREALAFFQAEVKAAREERLQTGKAEGLL